MSLKPPTLPVPSLFVAFGVPPPKFLTSGTSTFFGITVGFLGVNAFRMNPATGAIAINAPVNSDPYMNACAASPYVGTLPLINTSVATKSIELLAPPIHIVVAVSIINCEVVWGNSDVDALPNGPNIAPVNAPIAPPIRALRKYSPTLLTSPFAISFPILPATAPTAPRAAPIIMAAATPPVATLAVATTATTTTTATTATTVPNNLPQLNPPSSSSSSFTSGVHVSGSSSYLG
ncbi:hypothetical protein D3C77_324590 [compost metagenome]